MQNIEVSFAPTGEQLNEIKEWLLIEEHGKPFAGFYCNWNSIEYSFGRNEIAVIFLEKAPIGFLTWFNNDRVTTIQITEIKPGFRRMGYGKTLLEAVAGKLQNAGVAVLDLHCQPATSKKAWKKLGFKNYPDVEDFSDFNHEEGNWLYKILVPFDKPTKSAANKESIELWSVEPYLASRTLPAWKWHPKFEGGSRKLVNPIIFPANADWNIRWLIDGDAIKENKVKRFLKTEIAFSNFIIIEELPLSE